MTRLLVICFLSLAALVFVVPDATAQTPQPLKPNVDDLARAYYERGVKLFEQQRFVDALGEFAAGYELSRRPLFLWNMGECARLSQQGASARQYYERYLTADPAGQFADLARKRLELVSPAITTRPEIRPVESKSIPSPADAARALEERDRMLPAGPEGPRSTSTQWWKRWPIWTAVGVVVVGGSLAAYALSRDSGCSGSCAVINLRPN